MRLTGQAEGPGYHFDAHYEGLVSGPHIQLSGEQIWTAKQFAQPYHRPCGIELDRQ